MFGWKLRDSAAVKPVKKGAAANVTNLKDVARAGDVAHVGEHIIRISRSRWQFLGSATSKTQ